MHKGQFENSEIFQTSAWANGKVGTGKIVFLLTDASGEVMLRLGPAWANNNIYFIPEYENLETNVEKELIK